MNSQNGYKLFGIRHHGPGSARMLGEALSDYQPDCLLLEGPADASNALPRLKGEGVEPPLALLLYQKDQPKNAVFYPFAGFSPEWVALQWAFGQGCEIRMMDLPAAHAIGLSEKTEAQKPNQLYNEPPLHRMTRLAGWNLSSDPWDYFFEHNTDWAIHFEEVEGTITEARRQKQEPESQETFLREAFMRKTLRKAQKEGFERIAVVCGAWHLPALRSLPPEAKDNNLLKNLPKKKILSAWIPWSYSRLSQEGGYGAGVPSPGWYHTLFFHPNDYVAQWLGQAAEVLRQENFQVATAHLIEAQRLVELLAPLRGLHQPGLPEMNDAILSVMLGGQEAPLRLIERQLVISPRIGTVGEAAEELPLIQDVNTTLKKLRLPQDDDPQPLSLDLRKERDLQKSHFLRRLGLLEIPYGKPEKVRRAMGTFREEWSLAWSPEYPLALIEKSVYGNTLWQATQGYLRYRLQGLTDLKALAELLQEVLLAELPQLAQEITDQLLQYAAYENDPSVLLGSFPALAETARYGSVRQWQPEPLRQLCGKLIARLCIHLPDHLAPLSPENSQEVAAQLEACNRALQLFENPDWEGHWLRAMQAVADRNNQHGQFSGMALRFLLDRENLSRQALEGYFGRALSAAHSLEWSAAFIEGLFQNQAPLLIHEAAFFRILDRWLAQLDGERFTELLPVLRRTFVHYSAFEKKQLLQKAAHGESESPTAASEAFEPAEGRELVQALKAYGL